MDLIGEARRTAAAADNARTKALAQVHEADRTIAAHDLLVAIERIIKSQVAPVVDEAQEEIRAELEAEAARLGDRASDEYQAIVATVQSRADKLAARADDAVAQSSKEFAGVQAEAKRIHEEAEAALRAVKAEVERTRQAADKALAEMKAEADRTRESADSAQEHASAKLEAVATKLEEEMEGRRSKKLEKALAEAVSERIAERVEKRVMASVEREIEHAVERHQRLTTRTDRSPRQQSSQRDVNANHPFEETAE